MRICHCHRMLWCFFWTTFKVFAKKEISKLSTRLLCGFFHFCFLFHVLFCHQKSIITKLIFRRKNLTWDWQRYLKELEIRPLPFFRGRAMLMDLMFSTNRIVFIISVDLKRLMPIYFLTAIIKKLPFQLKNIERAMKKKGLIQFRPAKSLPLNKWIQWRLTIWNLFLS